VGGKVEVNDGSKKFSVNNNVVLLDIKYRNTVKQINLWVDFERKRKHRNLLFPRA